MTRNKYPIWQNKIFLYTAVIYMDKGLYDSFLCQIGKICVSHFCDKKACVCQAFGRTAGAGSEHLTRQPTTDRDTPQVRNRTSSQPSPARLPPPPPLSPSRLLDVISRAW